MSAEPGLQLNSYDPPERESLHLTECSLRAMKARLETILNAPALSEESFVEITAILNNVSYIFLYLEANNDQVSYDQLLPFRDAFYRDDALDLRILDKLYPLECCERDTERARLAYIRQLEDKRADPDPDHSAGIATLRAEASTAETELATAQADFVKRLAPNGEGRASALYYRVSARVQDPAVRGKLARAWSRVNDKGADHRGDIVDRMIALRHKDAARKGARTPLAATLEKCQLPEDEIACFLEAYLDRALEAQSALEKTLVATYGMTDQPFCHFGHYMRSQFSQKEVPLFDLDRCLEYAFRIAKHVFGLDISAHLAPGGAVIIAEASSNGTPVGRINFDLWRQNGQDRGANHTLGLRNKTNWRHVVQRPEAYVSCRFALAADGRRSITFQNVHSLLHEFGHAINHLIMREHLPNQSGLEYLPLERLECLSMWLEKWVYHGSFAEALGLGQDQRVDLALCQDAKKIEYLNTFAERAVIAVLDFECHRQDGQTLRTVYDRLDAAHGISRFVRFADIPQYFSWPMFIANPGANFSYLMGAAWSVEAYQPFASTPVHDVRPDVGLALFKACFSVHEPSTCPRLDNLPEFYVSGLTARKQVPAPMVHVASHASVGVA